MRTAAAVAGILSCLIRFDFDAIDGSAGIAMCHIAVRF
jgi:hypothetical protein